jgi:hypothetical protein
MSINKKETFADILESAQQLPEMDLLETLSPFSSPLPKGDKVVDSRKEVKPRSGPKYPFNMHIKKFVIGGGVGEDDDSSDQSAEYEDVINQALNGDYIIRFEERTITKDGLVIILLGWLTPIKGTKKVVSAPAEEESTDLLKFPVG